ncbi:unnamed protein product [Rotaria sp. Silwood1]|nr:unnamed protein product [Rotaria sp. Silwood1]
MLTRQYRLATSIVNNNSKVRKQFCRTVDDVEINTNTVPLIDTEKAKEISNLSPSMPRWWLVIPCVLLIRLASAPDALLINDFIVRRYERHYGLDTLGKGPRTACRLQSLTSTPGYWYLQQYSLDGANYDIVQKDAAKFNVKNSFATLIPSLFVIILLGSNCDTIGRRPLLLLPFIGKVARYVLMLIIIARDLSDGWLLVCHACEALFGSVGIVMLSALAFITDCTRESERTRPFLITEALAAVAYVIPVLAVGLWLRRFLYTVPTSVCLGLSIIGMLYVLFIQPESVRSV